MTATSSSSGRCARRITQAVTSAKKPDRRKLATTIIMPSSSVIVSRSIACVGVVERQRARHHHQAGADQRDAGAVDGEERDLAERQRQIAGREHDGGGERAGFAPGQRVWHQPRRQCRHQRHRNHGQHRGEAGQPPQHVSAAAHRRGPGLGHRASARGDRRAGHADSDAPSPASPAP